MALTTTTLAGAMSANATEFAATSATGATVGGFARLDGEYMHIAAITGSLISVRSRGVPAGSAVAHGIFAPVVFGLDSDRADPGKTEIAPVPTDYDLASIGLDGVIPIPTRDTVYWLTKSAAALALTLAAPSASQDGLMLTFVGCTDRAHVITCASLILDGTEGANSLCTSAAFKGSACTLIAWGARWHVYSNQIMIFTVS